MNFNFWTKKTTSNKKQLFFWGNGRKRTSITTTLKRWFNQILVFMFICLLKGPFKSRRCTLMAVVCVVEGWSKQRCSESSWLRSSLEQKGVRFGLEMHFSTETVEKRLKFATCTLCFTYSTFTPLNVTLIYWPIQFFGPAFHAFTVKCILIQKL